MKIKQGSLVWGLTTWFDEPRLFLISHEIKLKPNAWLARSVDNLEIYCVFHEDFMKPV